MRGPLYIKEKKRIYLLVLFGTHKVENPISAQADLQQSMKIVERIFIF